MNDLMTANLAINNERRNESYEEPALKMKKKIL